MKQRYKEEKKKEWVSSSHLSESTMFPAALSYSNNGLEERSWACAALQETKGSMRGWVTEWREREREKPSGWRRRQERRRTRSSSHLRERMEKGKQCNHANAVCVIHFPFPLSVWACRSVSCMWTRLSVLRKQEKKESSQCVSDRVHDSQRDSGWSDKGSVKCRAWIYISHDGQRHSWDLEKEEILDIIGS